MADNWEALAEVRLLLNDLAASEAISCLCTRSILLENNEEDEQKENCEKFEEEICEKKLRREKRIEKMLQNFDPNAGRFTINVKAIPQK